MCGRYYVVSTVENIEQVFEVSLNASMFEPRYNLAPTQMAPVITGDAPMEVSFFKWGLVPFWAKDPSMGSKLINARSESLGEKPSFRHLVQRKRCLVIADGYYEWLQQGKTKIPQRIYMENEQPFAMGGLWDSWKDAEGRALQTFTIVTVPAAPNIAFIHDRMPAIIPKEHHRDWLDEGLPPQEVNHLMQSHGENLRFHAVSNLVNSPRNEGPELLQEVTGGPAEQASLF